MRERALPVGEARNRLGEASAAERRAKQVIANGMSAFCGGRKSTVSIA
jgi:hypothetical protein